KRYGEGIGSTGLPDTNPLLRFSPTQFRRCNHRNFLTRYSMLKYKSKIRSTLGTLLLLSVIAACATNNATPSTPTSQATLANVLPTTAIPNATITKVPPPTAIPSTPTRVESTLTVVPPASVTQVLATAPSPIEPTATTASTVANSAATHWTFDDAAEFATVEAVVAVGSIGLG